MSLTALTGRPAGALPATARRLAVAAIALAAALALILLAGLLVGAGIPAAAPKNPFGTGLREPAAGAGGLGGWLLAVQSEFHRTLVRSLSMIRQGEEAATGLLALGFLYGVFHAAGPGHGKGVIASYIVATRRTLVRGLGLSTAAAFLQALVAITLVGLLALLLRAGSGAINAATSWIEVASFAILLAFGLALLWRKAGAVVGTDDEYGHHGGHDHHHRDHHHHHHAHDGPCGAGCAHAIPASEAARAATFRESAAIVAAAGLRPCSGAIILLVFGLSQGAFGVAVAAVLAMAAGTALTTGALAALAVLARGAASRLAAGRGEAGRRIVAWLETGAAAAIVVLGAILLAGTLGSGLPG